jgi:hypothetical protein
MAHTQTADIVMQPMTALLGSCIRFVLCSTVSVVIECCTEGLLAMLHARMQVDNAEVIQVARRALAVGRSDPQGPASAASRALVDRALRRSSSDNISVIMLLLHGRPITLPKSNSMLFKRSTLQLQGLSGADSPRCSTPCSGVSTPVVASRSSTPVQQHSQPSANNSALPSPVASCRPSGS